MRVAILGATGFGRFHAREFQRAGARVEAILGSSPASAAATAARLRADLGVEARPYHELDELLASAPDVVSVCTPHELHFAQCRAALEAGAFVLCEKPLFWNAGLSSADTEALLAELEHVGAAERLGVDLLNVHFVDALRERGRLPARPREVSIRFHTRGRFEGAEIAVDLLPHALSILQRLVPGGTPRDVTTSYAPRRAELRLTWAGVDTHVELCEDPEGDKLLAWSVDGTTFTREGQVDADGYRVVLREAGVERPHPVDDPLRTLVTRFLDFAAGRGRPSVDFADAAEVQRALTGLLAI